MPPVIDGSEVENGINEKGIELSVDLGVVEKVVKLRGGVMATCFQTDGTPPALSSDQIAELPLIVPHR